MKELGDTLNYKTFKTLRNMKEKSHLICYASLLQMHTLFPC